MTQMDADKIKIPSIVLTTRPHAESRSIVPSHLRSSAVICGPIVRVLPANSVRRSVHPGIYLAFICGHMYTYHLIYISCRFCEPRIARIDISPTRSSLPSAFICVNCGQVAGPSRESGPSVRPSRHLSAFICVICGQIIRSATRSRLWTSLPQGVPQGCDRQRRAMELVRRYAVQGRNQVFGGQPAALRDRPAGDELGEHRARAIVGPQPWVWYFAAAIRPSRTLRNRIRNDPAGARHGRSSPGPP